MLSAEVASAIPIQQLRLADVADIVMGQSPPGNTYNDQGVGLPFFQGKAEFGDVSPIAVKWCSSPTRIAEAGDILISVRAPVGPTNVAAEQCCIGRGLAAIRPSPNELDRDFLLYFFKYLEPNLSSKGQGSTFSAINKKELHGIEVPIPPLNEQYRIVDILKRADGIRRLHKQAQDTARQLIPALFIDMFGDPATNPKGWDVVMFADVGTLDRGKSKHRPRNDTVLFGGPYPFIQTGDVANSGGVIRKFFATYSEVGLQQSRLWPAGILCITIAANIADTATLGFDACFPDSVVGFIPNNMVTIEYVQYWLSFLKPVLESSAPQLAQKNINLRILRSLPIMVPPIEIQNEFVVRLQNIQSITIQQEAAQGSAESNFQSLLHRAFSGVLSTEIQVA